MTGSPWLLVALVCLATYRASRLVAVDRIFRAPREWLQNRFEDRWFTRNPTAGPSDEWSSPTAYLLGCVWCSSIWVGGLITAATWWTVGLPYPWLVWLAASAVSGWLASNEGD